MEWGRGVGTLRLGDTLYSSRENGRISENATRAPTGGEAAKESSVSTSSFIFINTCKFQEPFNLQARRAELATLLEASFRCTGVMLRMTEGASLNLKGISA